MGPLALPSRHVVAPYLVGVALLPLCALLLFGEYTVDPNPLIVLVHTWNLIIHEAGHDVFGLFGRTMMIAGGSILQLALPALFVYQGVYWSRRVGTQLALLLLGQNVVDVSIYAADAQGRALPHLGGDRVSHDWHTLLAQAGLLEATPVIAGLFVVGALACWAAMLAVPRWIL
ncbi:hypothetical protein [Rubrivirga sp. IMCC43871]|uniref:hypothetical protein n=1 Tax=Rubrivirga sp. IMCC43871 TaxID=3391575 RepID=UPI00399032E7